MKAEQQNAGFQPITLTLETKDEALLLLELLGATSGGVAEAAGVAYATPYGMYNALYGVMQQYPQSALKIEALKPAE